jgi:hypothetical protein
VREKDRLVQELSQTMEVIEKLEDVLSNEEVSPLGPILIAKVTIQFTFMHNFPSSPGSSGTNLVNCLQL